PHRLGPERLLISARRTWCEVLYDEIISALEAGDTSASPGGKGVDGRARRARQIAWGMAIGRILTDCAAVPSSPCFSFMLTFLGSAADISALMFSSSYPDF